MLIVSKAGDVEYISLADCHRFNLIGANTISMIEGTRFFTPAVLPKNGTHAKGRTIITNQREGHQTDVEVWTEVRITHSGAGLCPIQKPHPYYMGFAIGELVWTPQRIDHMFVTERDLRDLSLIERVTVGEIIVKSLIGGHRKSVSIRPSIHSGLHHLGLFKLCISEIKGIVGQPIEAVADRLTEEEATESAHECYRRLQEAASTISWYSETYRRRHAE
jgi:hypothetical protein